MGSSLSQESHRAARELFTKATEKFWKEAWGGHCESEDRMNQRMRREGNASEFALTSTHWCDLLLLISLWEWFHSPSAFVVGISVLFCRYHRTSVRLAVPVFSIQEKAKRDQSQNKPQLDQGGSATLRTWQIQKAQSLLTAYSLKCGLLLHFPFCRSEGRLEANGKVVTPVPGANTLILRPLPPGPLKSADSLSFTYVPYLVLHKHKHMTTVH